MGGLKYRPVVSSDENARGNTRNPETDSIFAPEN